MRKNFIKHSVYPVYTENVAPTVCFQKTFFAQKTGRFTLDICALGIGYCYLNGTLVSADLFTAPLSDYRKTLWFNRYDVTSLIKDGENELFVEVGNGFYNEGFDSAWGHNKAEWRGEPTLSLSVYKDGQEIFITDDSWASTLSQKTFYNELRSGEYFDARVEKETGWQKAVINENTPKGVLRLCECEPIREMERLSVVKYWKSKQGYIFDFGRNISGYVEIDVTEESGCEITLKHLEDIDENGELKDTGLSKFLRAPFQQNKVICNGKRVVWKPRFSYHGFRYVEVIGLTKEPVPSLLTAFFVHQAVDQIADFSCSDEILNKIYQAGIASTKSNMFYSFTDCPTREKLGWINDTAVSLEQIMFDFDAQKLLYKWFVDICDSMNEKGEVPGVVPSPDWGYEHGILCFSILFLLPYMAYKYYGDKEFLLNALPYMRRVYAYQKENMGKSVLGDWSCGFGTHTPILFVEAAYMYIFTLIFKLTDELQELPVDLNNEKDCARWKDFLEEQIAFGKCSVLEQSAIAALILLDLGDSEQLGKQLEKIIEYWDEHLHVGMFGAQFIYKALLKIGRADLAYSMITNPTAPSFRAWIDEGATALYETFRENPRTLSKNHHLYSNVLYFFIEGICGLQWKGKNVFEVCPNFISALTHAKCHRKTETGGVWVEWQREGDKIKLKIKTTGKVVASYNGEQIVEDEKIFTVMDVFLN